MWGQEKRRYLQVHSIIKDKTVLNYSLIIVSIFVPFCSENIFIQASEDTRRPPQNLALARLHGQQVWPLPSDASQGPDLHRGEEAPAFRPSEAGEAPERPTQETSG